MFFFVCFCFQDFRCVLVVAKNYRSLRSIHVEFHLPQMTHQTLSNSHSMVAAVQEQSCFLHFHLYIACNIVPEAVGMDRHPQPPWRGRKASKVGTIDEFLLEVLTSQGWLLTPTELTCRLSASTSSQFLDGHAWEFLSPNMNVLPFPFFTS